MLFFNMPMSLSIDSYVLTEKHGSLGLIVVAGLGFVVGAGVGFIVGALLGINVGFIVGALLGIGVGFIVGALVGIGVGFVVGSGLTVCTPLLLLVLPSTGLNVGA